MVRRRWGDGKGLVRRRNGGEEDNDAARRVATSSEKRENQIETAVFQKGGTLQEPRTGSIFIGGLPPLAGREVSITQFHFSKTVATRRAASFL